MILTSAHALTLGPASLIGFNVTFPDAPRRLLRVQIMLMIIKLSRKVKKYCNAGYHQFTELALYSK